MTPLPLERDVIYGWSLVHLPPRAQARLQGSGKLGQGLVPAEMFIYYAGYITADPFAFGKVSTSYGLFSLYILSVVSVFRKDFAASFEKMGQNDCLGSTVPQKIYSVNSDHFRSNITRNSPKL